MKVEAFMPMEMGSMGNVPSVIIWLHLRPLLAECRIGCRSSGTWLRSTVWWRLKWKVRVVWREELHCRTKVFSSPIEWPTISPTLQHNFRNSSMRDTGGVFQITIYVHTSWNIQSEIAFPDLFWEKCFLVSVNQDYIWMTGLVAVTTKSEQSVKPRRKAIGGKWL